MLDRYFKTVLPVFQVKGYCIHKILSSGKQPSLEHLTELEDVFSLIHPFACKKRRCDSPDLGGSFTMGALPFSVRYFIMISGPMTFFAEASGMRRHGRSRGRNIQHSINRTELLGRHGILILVTSDLYRLNTSHW